MEAREKQFGKKEILRQYISQINWDWLVFRSLTIFGSILILGLIAFFLWIAQ